MFIFYEKVYKFSIHTQTFPCTFTFYVRMYFGFITILYANYIIVKVDGLNFETTKLNSLLLYICKNVDSIHNHNYLEIQF